jgi:hypothetical protein
MLKINKEDIKDHLDWLKIQITISSAAIGAITLKATGATPDELKAASVLFILSIVLMVIGFSGIVEHKNSTTNVVPYISSTPVVLGHVCFLFALSALVLSVF